MQRFPGSGMGISFRDHGKMDCISGNPVENRVWNKLTIKSEGD